MVDFAKKYPGIFPRWGDKEVIVLRYQGTSLYAVGGTQNKSINDYVIYDLKSDHNRRELGLSLWESIPIAGCDLLSSCLFTTGNCASRAGKLTPVGLGLVTVMLYFFRKVYSEIVTAIPNNGGCYNAFLNTSSKLVAGMTSCLSILSYVATALVAAYDGVLYLELLYPDVDYRLFTILILAVFAILTILGVKESSFVCQILFTIHSFTLTLIILWGVAYGFQDNFKIFNDNVNTPYPDIITTEGDRLQTGNWIGGLFYGYSASLLGITGFETAANYVEEMKDNGVYVSTINWMWVFSGLFNPCIGLIVLFVLPMDKIYESSGNLLAVAGQEMGGNGFKIFICIDSLLILCGAVVTSYVGCCGLLRRLAQDRLLPEFFLDTNSRGTQHWGPIWFFIVTASLFLGIYKPGNEHGIEQFGGVFAIAFLCVMALFSLACMALKIQRPEMARMAVCPWWQVILCFCCVVVGLIGNILLAPSIISWFVLYFVIFSSVVLIMYSRVEIIKQILWMIQLYFENQTNWHSKKKNLKSAHTRQEEYGEYGYLEVVRRNSTATDRIPSDQVSADSPTKSGGSLRPLEEEMTTFQTLLEENKYVGPVIDKLLSTQNRIMSNPIVYLTKPNDILSITEALDYVKFNEQTKHVIVVHIVDDRHIARRDCDPNRSDVEILKDYQTSNVLRKSISVSYKTEEDAEFTIMSALNAASPSVIQLCDNVALYLRVSCLIIRGSYFCPATVLWLSTYLQIDTGSMFMAMPSTEFKFPLASFKGVRVILKPKPKQSQKQTIKRINEVIMERSYFDFSAEDTQGLLATPKKGSDKETKVTSIEMVDL